jgi:chemotaxis protein methyltransferase CheR
MMPLANSSGSGAASSYGIELRDYEFVREFLRREIGYDLGSDRHYLVHSRLLPIAASFDIVDVSQLIARLRVAPDRRLREAIFEAMTINETSFFRGGPRLFDALAGTIIPSLLPARAAERRLRIWCGACSTGQEPYSIALTLAEQCPQLRDWRIEILATDVAERALDQARRGVYNQFEVQRGLPIQTLLKHFKKEGDHWHIATALKGQIEFRRHNLLDSFLFLAPPFDIIFLRNVLIYFDAAAKTELFGRLRPAVANDGYLVLGETESVLGLTDQFILSDGIANCFVPAQE